jgi:hypothetical protein
LKAATEKNSGCSWTTIVPYAGMGEPLPDLRRFFTGHGWSPSGKQLGFLIPFAVYGAAIKAELERLATRYAQELREAA